MAGELNEGLKHGVGHMRWHDGRMFAGGFVGGKMTGLGVLMEADGSVFLGRFRECDQDGYGGFFSSDGIVLIGMWRSGRRHGAGVEQEEREGQVKWKAVVQYEQDELVDLDDFSSGLCLEPPSPLTPADKVSSWIEAAERTIHDACRRVAARVRGAAADLMTDKQVWPSRRRGKSFKGMTKDTRCL